jgi:hypothetical protein
MPVCFHKKGAAAMYKNHILKVLAKATTDGAQTLGNRGFEYLPHHQIQVDVSAQPSAGTLKIEYMTPGASEYVEITGSPIDLTALNKSAAFRIDDLFSESFRFTPVLFDAGKTYSVLIVSNE